MAVGGWFLVWLGLCHYQAFGWFGLLLEVMVGLLVVRWMGGDVVWQFSHFSLGCWSG